ncbi:two-component system, LuxR family, sensor histidine kinase TtrS [Meinhardsimonia xiamenensis]|jgi:two-component system sensor histidine kinase TtrS|uniref:Two-component system, LuxR family, sensor histidine kinase TtrS n=1 Tax=Meinhardsimonia xiamenensis TaxID=990712 RepID=A0A1G9GBQ9_9RHOB|nr:PhnD/SsuA/transferrin family substrate-binding protein [Meinhardsimonia xiamenensis]PRX31976.1 two-component system sensor histidine kinase TtrS [Meinhardsimonia xiamenensis]SDK98067.1 two-component system, LuxR family, sensor histidine kinase TtrS [Meinhardsimonia xiamenensis]
MSPVFLRLATLLLALCAPAPPLSAMDDTGGRLHVGVLAYRGAEITRERWGPVAEAWEAALPGVSVEILPLTLQGMETALLQRRVDVVATNPGHFAALEERFDLAAIATRVVLAPGVPDGLVHLGSAVVVRADSGLEYLRDLRGRRVAAVSADAFGGFMLAWEEMTAQQIDPFADLGELVFTGFPLDAIIDAVLAGEVDAGIVRAGLLESMVAEGRIEAGALRVLQPRSVEGFPFATTTRLYPEWPLAVTPWMGRHEAGTFLRASLDMPLESTGMGWTAAQAYQPARRLLAEFRAAQAARDAGGPFALWAWIVGAALVLAAILAGLAVFAYGADRRRHPASAEHREARDARRRLAGLTARERQVLALVAQGLSSKEMAARLGVSLKTVEYHRGNILKKTGARSAADLARLATLAQLSGDDSSRAG